MLQIILKADVPVKIRMEYAALAGCHRFWNGPFTCELVVEPLKDGDIVLTITVDQERPEKYEFFIRTFEVVPVQQSHICTGQMDHDVSFAFPEHLFVSIESLHPGGVGHASDYDKVCSFGSQHEIMIHQRVVIHDLSIDMEEIDGIPGPFLV